MSANESLSPDQFDHESPLTHFGLDTVSASEEKDLCKFHGMDHVNQTLRLPTSALRGGQYKVDTARVHSIASQGLNDPREADSGPVQATGLPDGRYMLDDGHHRVAANILRGEQFHDVHVGWKYK